MRQGTRSHAAPRNPNSYVLQQRASLASSLSEKINKFEEKIAEVIGKFIYDREHMCNPLSHHSPTARRITVLLTKYKCVNKIKP